MFTPFEDLGVDISGRLRHLTFGGDKKWFRHSPEPFPKDLYNIR